MFENLAKSAGNQRAKLASGTRTAAISCGGVGYEPWLPGKVRSWRLKFWVARVLLSLVALGGAAQAGQVEDPQAIANKAYAEIKRGLNVNLSNTLVNQYFDTPSMAIHALGSPYRSLSNDQKKAYVQAFDAYFKKTLYRFLTTYKDVTMSNLTSRIEGDRAIARCVLIPVNDQPIELAFPLFLGRENWKANDVVVDSVSLIVAYKPQFNRLFQQGGFDGLVAYLNSH
jgi:ABC-type transporter MlaC component